MKNYTKNELKNAVYKCIKENSYASPNEIANTLKIMNCKELLDVINELRTEFYITLNPIPLSDKNNCSCRYTATTKEYVPKDN
ncbi:MAG: hypothetical protein IKL10_10375 [Clostridia bacterium]|nr:hypothetical protein [Clostridia bacterium]